MAYWSRLRGGGRFPSTSDLDAARITSDWPNSILVRCRSGSRALEPEKVFAPAGRLGAGTVDSGPSAKIELSPMMLQWLLSLAGDAVRERRPMQDTEAFPSLKQSIRYRAVALPLSDDQSGIDHVLCHVCRVM